MAEYINRTALLENLPDEPYKGVLRRVLMQAPVADVAPVVHAKWEIRQTFIGNVPCCSQCGNTAQETDYCPHCGAKMGGGD